MKRIFIGTLALSLALTSCVSKKKYTSLEDQYNECEDKLSNSKLELAQCKDDKKTAAKEIAYLKNTNYQLLNNVSDLATLSKKEAENLERSLESIKEKDMQITSLNQAVNKKDSVTLALVTSIKGVLGDMSDSDIEVSVEKGVVFISISDKLLFNSGSYNVNSQAKSVLAKVAKVVNDKPEIDIMVEGHTDNKTISNAEMKDNWDLSVKRATSIVRVLQNDYQVNPQRMTAAGRSEYLPVASNDTAEDRAKNRRTRIIILPKLDQFSELVEEGMKAAPKQ